MKGNASIVNENVCGDHALSIYNSMMGLFVGHVGILIILLYREIYDA